MICRHLNPTPTTKTKTKPHHLNWDGWTASSNENEGKDTEQAELNFLSSFPF